MFNIFSKIILIFFLCIALQNYAMETNYECNQPSYSPEANSELLQVINAFWKEDPTEEDLKKLSTEKNWKNIIKCLENGADPNLKGKHGTTILEVAILGPSCNIKTKQYLYDFFKYGVNPNICNNKGRSPLHVLLSLKKNPYNLDQEILEMLEILLQNNANPNLPLINKIPTTQENYSLLPLDLAINYQNKNYVKILIKHNANINAKNSLFNTQPFFHYNVTPLARTIVYDKFEIMRVLCREYASLEDVSDFCEETAFQFALRGTEDPAPAIKTLIVNARFKLPTTEKKIDSIALELLLVLKHQFKSLKIPKELQFRMLSMLPATQNWTEPDSILYEKLFHENYKKPYFFSRLHHHITNIVQILNKKNKLGKNSISLLVHHEKTKQIMPQLNKDIKILLESKQEVSPDNLALQICNNYEELEEEQIQSTN